MSNRFGRYSRDLPAASLPSPTVLSVVGVCFGRPRPRSRFGAHREPRQLHRARRPGGVLLPVGGVNSHLRTHGDASASGAVVFLNQLECGVADGVLGAFDGAQLADLTRPCTI